MIVGNSYRAFIGAMLVLLLLSACDKMERYRGVLPLEDVKTEGIDDNKYLIFDKSDQKLYLVENHRIIRSYPAVYGKAEGRKERQGDFKTPEGSYRLIMKNPHSRWHLFIGLDYPSQQDAKDAFANGLINKQQMKMIVNSENSNGYSFWYTPLGGAIGIHGISAEYENYLDKPTRHAPLFKINWTAGCIALTNDHMEDLADNVRIGKKTGTRIIIRQ